MAEPAPISRLTTSERVAAEVRRRIWTGELASGSRLNQDELADQLGVSRIPVREALIALAHEGAIRMAPHRGAFVEVLDEDAVRDHYDLFALVDGFALARTVERATPEQRADLAEWMRAIAAVDDLDDLFRVVNAARARVHELGGSPRFIAVADGLRGLVPGNFFVEVDGAAAVARAAFPVIAESLAMGDADTAITTYEDMLRAHGALVVDRLRSDGVLAEPGAVV